MSSLAIFENLAHQVQTGEISKRQLLEELSRIQKEKTAGGENLTELNNHEQALKRELVKILLDEKRRSIGKTKNTQNTTSPVANGVENEHAQQPQPQTQTQQPQQQFPTFKQSPPFVDHNQNEHTFARPIDSITQAVANSFNLQLQNSQPNYYENNVNNNNNNNTPFVSNSNINISSSSNENEEEEVISDNEHVEQPPLNRNDLRFSNPQGTSTYESPRSQFAAHFSQPTTHPPQQPHQPFYQQNYAINSQLFQQNFQQPMQAYQPSLFQPQHNATPNRSPPNEYYTDSHSFSNYSPEPFTSENIQYDQKFKTPHQPRFTSPLQKRPQSAASVVRNDSFFERSVKWKEMKQAESGKTRKEREQRELGECTFTPHLVSTPLRHNTAPVVERLYSDQKNRLQELEQERIKLEEERVLQTCTFKPQLNTTSLQMRVPSRATKTPKRLPSPTPEISYTFTPHVNKVKSNMGSAQLYLEIDPFERLSKVKSFSQDQDQVKGEQDELESSIKRRPARPSSAPKRSYSSNSSHSNEGNGNNHKHIVGEGVIDKVSFNDFLQRQQHHVEKTARKIESIKDSIETVHEPQICEQSREIANKKRQGDFLERLASSNTEKRESTSPSSDQFSFQPNILPVSRQRKARSSIDMSVGDMIKKEAMLSAMKLRAEEHELKEVTFKPKTNKTPGVESKLKVVSDPEAYMRRLSIDKELKDQKALARIEELKTVGLDKCTFTPTIHDAPLYVKRIARSIALAKGERKNRVEPDPNKRPDWR